MSAGTVGLFLALAAVCSLLACKQQAATPTSVLLGSNALRVEGLYGRKLSSRPRDLGGYSHAPYQGTEVFYRTTQVELLGRIFSAKESLQYKDDALIYASLIFTGLSSTDSETLGNVLKNEVLSKYSSEITQSSEDPSISSGKVSCFDHEQNRLLLQYGPGLITLSVQSEEGPIPDWIF